MLIILQERGADAGTYVEMFLQPLLKNLDPSLFQNIILGILAIFIPFAIVFLADVLDSKKERSEFEKMVLGEEVLGVKKIFWLSVFGIGTLAFFNGKNLSIDEKLIAVLIILLVILYLGRFFEKTLRFSEGHKAEFEINFLKRLNLSKVFRLGNKLKIERMVRAWNSFWLEKSTYNEREFTEVFVEHIDHAIKEKRYGLAVLLARAYQENLDKREVFSMGYEILPKLFEWHEKLWEAQKEWLKKLSEGRKYEEKIQRVFSSKYFPTFKKWAFYLLKKVYERDDLFWNWHYFQQKFFPTIEKILLLHDEYQLFSCFKRYIDDIEAKLEKVEGEDKKQSWWKYITGLFGSFCPLLFEKIGSAPNKFDIWEHSFPKEWKVTAANSKKRIPRIVLQEFLRWAQQRIFKENKENYDKDLTEVVNGIFPNVHHNLFPSFLILFFSREIKYAIQKELNFFFTNTLISWSDEKSDEEIDQMFHQNEQSQKEETINIIFDYFSRDWELLKPHKDDLTKEEFSSWDGYSMEQQKPIVDRVRKSKLQETLKKLSSTEIMDLCKESERFEDRRRSLIELITLLLTKIQE
jgi:hypothetical protein